MKTAIQTHTYTRLMIIGLLCFGAFGQVNGQESSASDVTQKAAQAGIEASTVTELQARAQAQGLSDDQFEALMNPAIALADDNMPYELILDKAFEGLAKKIPAQVLANVLDRLQNTTRQSAEIVVPWIENPAVDRAMQRSGQDVPQFRKQMTNGLAKAISQDVTPETLQDLMDMLSDEDVLSASTPSTIAATIAVLPEIHAAINNPVAANQLLQRALKGGFGSAEVQKLPVAIKTAQSRSQLPSGAVIEGVFQQMGNGFPAAQILQNLFNGNPGGGPPEGAPGRQGRGNSGSQGQ